MLSRACRLSFLFSTLIVVGLCSPSAAGAQQTGPAISAVVHGQSPAGQTTAQASQDAPHVPLHADLSPKIALSGHLPGWLSSAQDAGQVPEAVILHLDFTLTRAPAAQAAFGKLLHDQQTPGSPFYHVWLTPQQIGELYGPHQADIDQLTSWLTERGFHIDEVTPSRLFIRVSAPAQVSAEALGTQFRMFALQGDLSGKLRLSAISEPKIPAAFSALVAGIAGLAEAAEEPQHHMEIVPAAPALQPGEQPGYTSSSTGNHYIAPGDFATMYDVPSTFDGTGQKIAVIGRSRVNSADITNYETAVGLPSKLPTVVIPPTATDPGVTGTGDQGEATLDVQRVLGTAPGVQADLVIATSASGGIRAAAQYNVQTLLDPVMTISFGACELNAGPANVNLYTQLFAQAAAEGVSVVVSSDDSGAAGCDAQFQAPPSTTQIASINYICSSGFATCVGGTEFAADFTSPSAYWSSTNSSTRSSALSYIPEGAWNEPTHTDSLGTTNYIVAATGGGASIYTPKPAFQTGNGVPADGFRDTPDVSFSSSGHDAYFGCYAQNGGGSCVRDPATGSFSYVGFYGTSAAAPSMAAITAMLNQKLGAAQGNLNPLLYRLANASSFPVFHDTTVASSGVASCDVAVPSLCNNSTPSATGLTGGLSGYLLTPGYDLATGWGSIDVANLLRAASATGAPTQTTLTGTTGNIQLTTPTVAFQAAVVAVAAGSATPTGTVQFFSNGTALSQPVALVAGIASLTLANNFAFGAYLVTATYSGDSTFDASNSAAITFTVVPGTTPDTLSLSSSPTPVTTAQASTLTSVVTGTSGGPTPTGTVTFSQSLIQGNFPIVTVPLVNGTAIAHITFGGGYYAIVANYSGDVTYAASTSPYVVSINPLLVSTTTSLSGPQTIPVGTAATVSATVGGLSPVFASSAPVTFFDNGVSLGSVPLTKSVLASTTGTATFTTRVLSAGTHSITASFAGDANTLPSTSAPLLIAEAGFVISPATPSITLAAGATQGNTDLLTATSVGGFAGPVALSCAVSFNGSQTAAFPPTCALSGGSVGLTAAGTATSTLTISTTLPQAAVTTALSKPAKPGHSGPFIMLCALLAALWPWASFRRTRAKLPRLTLLILSAACLVGIASLEGCGSSASPSTPAPAPKAGTTPGVYTITITASGSGAGTTNTNITLNVQ